MHAREVIEKKSKAHRRKMDQAAFKYPVGARDKPREQDSIPQLMYAWHEQDKSILIKSEIK